MTPDSFFGLQSRELPQRQTLVESAARVLSAHLDSGRWADFLPGERLLCEELQISRPTLRQALKVLEREKRVEVAQGRRRRILAKTSPGISIGRRNVVALLSPVALKQLPPFALFWIDEIRSELAKVCCRLEFRVSHACAARKPGPALERLVHDAPATLWILLLSSPPIHQWFLERKLPCLVAGSCLPGVSLPSVNIDFRAACRHAVGVFRRRGHSRLALVVPAGGLAGDVDGEEGFCEALANGPPPVILRHNSTREDILRRVAAALDSACPPTGFLVSHSAHALTVLTLLLRRGLQLPSQAALIARDDDAFLDFVTPRLARYTADPAIFARHLTHLILQMIRSGPVPFQACPPDAPVSPGRNCLSRQRR